MRFILLHGLVSWCVFWCGFHLVRSLFLCGSFLMLQSPCWIFSSVFFTSTNCSVPFGDCVVEVLNRFLWFVHLSAWVFSMIINSFNHQDSELPPASHSPICQFLPPIWHSPMFQLPLWFWNPLYGSWLGRHGHSRGLLCFLFAFRVSYPFSFDLPSFWVHLDVLLS